jgi:membrane protein DedA with SNARE-associated domain
VMAIAAAGAVLGDNAGYYIGHRIGRATLERYGRHVGLTHARVAHMDRFFASHGDKTILVARFITGLRVFAALLAGSSRMHWRTFAFYNMMGAVLWSFVITLAGYFFGRSWELLERWVKGAGMIALAIAVVVVITVVVLKRRKRKAEEKAALESEDCT